MSVKVISNLARTPRGFTRINVSNCPLTPHQLGPVTVYPLGAPIEAKSIEHAWQYSKVYAHHLNEKGEIKIDEWMKWARKGFAQHDISPRSAMCPASCTHACIMDVTTHSLGVLIEGWLVPYLHARQYIYPLEYAMAVKKYHGDLLTELKRRVANGEHIALADITGYDRRDKSYCDIAANLSVKMSHAFVLAALIEGNEWWDHPILSKRTLSNRI